VEEAKNGGENLSQQNWGNLSPKMGGVAPDFDSRFGGQKQLLNAVIETRSILMLHTLLVNHKL